MNRITTTKITSVVIAATLLALAGCTGNFPEGQSFREDKAAITEIDGCKIRKFYIKTSASDHGEPVFMARCSGEEVTTMTKRDSGKNAVPARVLIIRENGVDKLFEEKK